MLGDPFVAVGYWEASKKGSWPDFPQVAEELQRAALRDLDLRADPKRGDFHIRFHSHVP